MSRRGGRRSRAHRQDVALAGTDTPSVEKAEHAFAVYSHTADFFDSTLWESEANKGDVYKDSVWAFVSIRAVAIAAATIRWALKEKTGTPEPDREIYSHPLLDLIEKPNPHCTRYDLVEELVWQYMLEGDAYVEMVPPNPDIVTTNRKFLPIGLYALKSKHVSPLPDPKTRVLGYSYSPNGESIVYRPWEMIQVRAYNPENDTDGYSAFRTARTSVDIDRDTQSYSKKFFERGAFPSAALETDRILPKPLQQRVQREWKSKFGLKKNPHEVALLMAGLKYKPISFTFRDMDFEKLRKLTREEILATSDVPPLLVGLLDGSSWANAHQQKLDFVTNTVGPILRKMHERFNLDLVSRFDSNLYFEPDFVSYLKSPEQDESNERRSRALWKDGLITRNEARDMAGFDPAEKEGELYIDEIRDLRNTGSTSRARSSPSQSVDGEERPLEGLPDSPSRSPDVEHRARLEQSFDEELRENQLLLHSSVGKLRGRYQGDFTTCLVDMFSEQSRSCVDKFLKVEGEESSVDAVFENSLEEYLGTVSKGYVNGFLGVLLPLAKEASELVVSFLFGFETLYDSDFSEHIHSAIEVMAKRVNKTTAGRMARIVGGGNKGVTKGEAQTLIVSAFEDCVDKNRMRTVVDSETTRAINLGIQSALEANGWIAKTWVCGQGNSRDTHAAMNGQTIPVGEKFLVDGDYLLYPGDIDGSPENVCGCTCAIVPGVPSDLNKGVEGGQRSVAAETNVLDNGRVS